MKVKPLSLGLVALAVALPAMGQEQHETMITEADILGDIPEVSFASRLQQPITEAPVSVTIIDRALIEASGAQTWADIFRLVPGFQSYYINNHRFGVSYHGLGKEFPNHLEVMVDGRSVYEPLFSAVSWNTLGIDLADIESIEIVRGSSAPAHGSNAFLGAVNIITHKPVQDGGLKLDFTVGDIDTRNGSLHYSGDLADLNYRLTLGYRHDTGFPAVPDGPLKDGQELYHGNFRAIYTPNLSDTLDLQLGHADNNVGWGDSDHPDEFSSADMISSFQSVKWSRNLQSGNEIRLHAYHNLLRGDNFFNLGPVWSLIGLDAETAAFIRELDPIPQSLIDDFAGAFGTDPGVIADLLPLLDNDVIEGFKSIRSERYDVEIEHHLRLNGSLRAVWGAGARYEQLRSAALFDSDDWIDENAFRLFGHTEWELSPQLLMNAGLMVEETFTGTLVSPRLAANFLLHPNHSIRAAIARGHRSPSLLEANEYNIGRFGDFVYQAIREADNNLGEERVDSYELSYILLLPYRGLSFDLSLFREEISDGIDDYKVPTDSPTSLFDEFQNVTSNTAEWTVQGVEFQLTWQLPQNVFVRAHYANVDLDSRRLDAVDPVSVYEDFDNRMARHSGGLLLGKEFGPHWSASLFSYYQSQLRWADGDSIDSFNRLDAQLGYRLLGDRYRGQVRLIAQNLGGGDYSEFNDNNIFETRIFLHVELNFNY